MHVNTYVIQVDLTMIIYFMRTTYIPYYLGQHRNELKGNRSMGEPGKVNSDILYTNELDPEKHTIT